MSENHMIGDLDQTDSDISQVASCIRTFLVAQRYRICLPMQETGVLSLGWQDPLEEAMATHFSILAWEIPCTEEPEGLQSMASQKSQTQLGD